jgi:hypothetical protein
MAKYYPLDQEFTNYNNVQYYGNSISKYDRHITSMSDENVFIQLNLFNPVVSQRPIVCSYEDNRQQPIIPYKPNKYGLCVNSVYLPSESIYLFEWVDTITPIGGLAYNKYTINVRYWDGNVLRNRQEVVNFTPYFDVDINGPVKRVYEINQCLQSLNDAYARAFAHFPIPYEPPRFVMDKETSLIYIICDIRYNDYTNAGNANAYNSIPATWTDQAGIVNIQLSWNYWVHQWFAQTFNGSIVRQQINEFEFFRTGPFFTGDATQVFTLGGQSYYKMYQANSTTELFSTVEKIVIVSDLPIRNSYTSVTGFGSATALSNPTIQNSNQFLSILIDFPLTLSSYNNTEIEAPIVYTPKLHYWIDIESETPISRVNYRIYVQRTDGTLSDVLLYPGQCATVKLLFRLK